MTGEFGDASKVDLLNAINVTYEDLSEKLHQKFEADLKRQNKEIRTKMLACYGKTQQGVIEKEKFVMPAFQSATPPAPSTTTSTSPTTDVSTPKDPLVHFLREFVDKFEKSQTLTQNLIFEMHEMIEKGKSVDTSYSTKDIAQSSAAPASNDNVQYGMPPNYFAGQTPPSGTVRLTTAEPVRPVASTGQTGAMVLASASTPALAPIPIRPLLAEPMNWRSLFRHIPPDHMASHLLHLLCHKMFGTI